MSLVVVGIALASPLAAWTMAKVGRKQGHLVGIGFSLLGVGIAALSLVRSNFLLYCIGNAFCGVGTAYNNQIRFTAAEKAGTEKAVVHSWVLTFSLFAAFLGPWIAQQGRDLLGEPYVGSFGLVGGMLALLMVLLAWLPSDSPSAEGTASTASQRISRRDILTSSKFWLGALSGTASFATMTLLMSATPLQTHEVEHFSHGETTQIIQSHIVAMFFPSLFSGLLLKFFGVKRLIWVGVAIFFVCIAIAFQSSHFHHYWWALVLLGVGWNFLFLASSTWISQSYSGPERFVAQGMNDLFVFGTQSIASLSAGALLFSFGWQTLVLVPLPFLLGLLAFTVRLRY